MHPQPVRLEPADVLVDGVTQKVNAGPKFVPAQYSGAGSSVNLAIGYSGCNTVGVSPNPTTLQWTRRATDESACTAPRNSRSPAFTSSIWSIIESETSQDDVTRQHVGPFISPYDRAWPRLYRTWTEMRMRNPNGRFARCKLQN